MNKWLFTAVSLFAFTIAFSQDVRVRKKDRKRDVMMVTDSGSIVLRLSDSTPLHRDNFIKLVKLHFYEDVSFHRVIQGFVIQAGDPATKKNKGDTLGIKNPKYTVPAEIRQSFYHKRGMLAAARMGDDVNPEKKSSGTQFYIVQGRIFSPESLDSVETHRLKGKKISADRRAVYQTVGGIPHLDQNYTIFGEVVSGMEVVDKIAATKTTGRQGNDKPLKDIKIQKVTLVRRTKK
jgi:peptidyl-prolyl cis-trans isomerase B (cyclophilin B)